VGFSQSTKYGGHIKGSIRESGEAEEKGQGVVVYLGVAATIWYFAKEGA